MSLAPSTKDDTCFVIGSGPSLRGFDFHRLSGFATIGMNAAYRYWRQIDWYPTYYSCLDDELTATHWREIVALVREGKVRKAFVSGILHQYDASIVADDRFVLLDQFTPHWHYFRGKALGVPYVDSPHFKSTQDSKVTTGSHSVRFAAHLGYKNICLLGIDLKYVEKIPEAEQVGEIALRIRETPKHNPNYFFDGYQQAGDRYNIPNPSEHDGDLHLASLKAVRDDFARTPTAPRIINCNSQSRLFEDRVFPYQHVDRALNDRPLSAVVVPTTLKERDTLLNQLWLCEQKNFAPEPSGKFLKPALTYVFNSGDSRSLEEEIAAQFQASGRLKEAFEAPTFMNIGLLGEQDEYIRDYSRPAGRFGYKAGPNNQFFETIGRHAGSTHYLFLMETDCLPIRAGWLGQLQTRLHHAEPFWILGSGYRGRTTLGEAYKRHINGNAIYAAGDVVFQHFIETFWRPELERVIRANPRIAYDCALEILMGEAVSDEPDNPTWRITQELMHLVRYTDMIHNRSGGRDSWDTPPDLPGQLYREDPVAYFLHGKPFADGLAAMRKTGVADIRNWKVSRDQTPLVPGTNRPAPMIVQSDEFPRILVIDHTLMGDNSATGELKASLFKEWPKSQYMQIHGGNTDTVGFARDAGNTSVDLSRPDQRLWIRTRIDDFKPEMIFYRPVPDTMPLHDFAMEVINAYDVPLVSWIMDDWPKSLEGRDKAQFEKLDQDWRILLQQSAGALSIGDAMSRAFEKRYRTTFQPFANAIDPSQWGSEAPSGRSGILVRYSGSLSQNMGLESIFQVAEAVETLAREGLDIRFEIKTRQHWLEAAGARFNALTRTTITTRDLPAEEYRAWLSDADVVLIAYNFDEASKDYVRYSIANKLPECLASGAVLLAIGPPDIASIQLLDSLDCSVTVKSPDAGQILAALRDISGSQDERQELVLRARRIASKRFDIRKVRAEFMAWIRDTLRASHVNLSLTIARNAERRRWMLAPNYVPLRLDLIETQKSPLPVPPQWQPPPPAPPAPTPWQQPPPQASQPQPQPPLADIASANGYILPSQVVVRTPVAAPPPLAPPPAPHVNGGSTSGVQQTVAAQSAPLTIFPVMADRSENRPAGSNVQAGAAGGPLVVSIVETGPMAALQMPDQNPGRRPALPESSGASLHAAAVAEAQPASQQAASAGARGLPSWLKSHIGRSRIAQAAIAAIVLIVLAGVVVITLPATIELRAILLVVGGLAVLSMAGFYFAYRTLSFARRLTGENQMMKESLEHSAAKLKSLENNFRTSSAQQSAVTSAIAQRIERHTASGFSAIDARLAELASLSAELAALRDAQNRTQSSVQALAGQGAGVLSEISEIKARQTAAQSVQSALSAQLAEAGRHQVDVETKLQSVIGEVSGQVLQLADKLDGDAVRIGELSSRQSQADDIVDRLDALTRDAIASTNDRFSSLQEHALIQAERSRHLEQRVDVVEGAIAESASNVIGSIAAQKEEVARIEARAASESGHFIELTTRVATLDDFAKQVSSNLSVADEDLKQSLATIAADINSLAASASDRFHDISARVANVDDFSKQVSSDLNLAHEDLRQSLTRADEERRELSRMIATVQQVAQADKNAIVLEIAQLPDLAERLAAVDDFAKQLCCDVRVADEDTKKAIHDLSKSVSGRLVDVGARIASADKAQTEIKVSIINLQRDANTDRQTIVAVGQQLADVAGSSEQVVAATSNALSALDARLGDSEASLLTSLKVLTEVTGTLDEKFGSADARLASELAGLSSKLADVSAVTALKADGKVLEGVALRVSTVEANANGAVAQLAKTQEKLSEGLAGLGSALASVDKTVASKADGKALEDVALRLAEAAELSENTARHTSQELATVDARISAIESGADGAGAQIAEAREKIGTLQEQLNSATGKLADQFASLGSQLVSVEKAVATKADGKALESAVARAVEVDKSVQGAASKASAEREAITSRLSEVSSNVERLAENVARRSSVADEALSKTRNDLEQASKLILSRVERSEQGLATASSAQKGLLEAIGRLEADAKTGVGSRASIEKQVAEIVRQMQESDAKASSALREINAKLEDVATRLAEAEDGGASESAQLTAQLSALGDRLAAEHKERRALETRLGELSAALSDVKTVSGKTSTQLSAQVSDLDARLAMEYRDRSALQAKAEAALSDLGAKLAASKAASDKQTVDVAAKLSEVASKVGDLDKTTKQLSGDLPPRVAAGEEAAAKARSAQAEAEAKLAGIFTKLTETTQRLDQADKTLMFDNRSWYQRFNRKLQQQHIQVLEKEWTRKLSVQASKPVLGYMAARAVEMEHELDGRLATTVEDVILRTLVAQATKGQSVEVLEIGTLFGVGAAIMFDTLKNHFDNIHFTLLDPLEGYYAGGRPDVLTGQPVTEKTVRRNMARAGMREDQLRLITRLSTEPDAIKEASERLYDVLVIDADHSYAGVKTDFENYGRLVRLGGYVIFDDYGSEDWPDVKAYVDAEIPAASFLAHVGNSWRTSVYRVVKPPPEPQRVRVAAAPRAARPAAKRGKRKST